MGKKNLLKKNIYCSVRIEKLHKMKLKFWFFDTWKKNLFNLNWNYHPKIFITDHFPVSTLVNSIFWTLNYILVKVNDLVCFCDQNSHYCNFIPRIMYRVCSECTMYQYRWKVSKTGGARNDFERTCFASMPGKI